MAFFLGSGPQNQLLRKLHVLAAACCWPYGQRLGPAQAATADQDHDYMAEQQAFDHGLMDKFVEFTGTPETGGSTKVMDYFDGNSVTAFWNYAQNYAIWRRGTGASRFQSELQ